jgi:hypothetical protein
MSNDLFVDGEDPFEDPSHRRKTKPTRLKRSSRIIGCSMPWFVWMFPLVKSKEQLALALYLYRRCCVCGYDTVTVPTDELVELGLGRWGKYRLLISLEQAGVLRVKQTEPQKTIRVQLCAWPDPPL